MYKPKELILDILEQGGVDVVKIYLNHPSIESAADEIGVSRSTLQRWLQGKVKTRGSASRCFLCEDKVKRLRFLYYEEGLGVKKICQRLGVSNSCFYSYIRANRRVREGAHV
jgi:transposase